MTKVPPDTGTETAKTGDSQVWNKSTWEKEVEELGHTEGLGDSLYP